MMKAIYRIALIGGLVLILMPITNTVFAGGKTIPQIIDEAKSQTMEVTVEEVKKGMELGINLNKTLFEYKKMEFIILLSEMWIAFTVKNFCKFIEGFLQ